ncbi:MAG: hypothetical protein OXB86_02655 [Bdellovibrionales bacterium]|nr:hypothetical protein [Bdellovibrionales bacterium]
MKYLAYLILFFGLSVAQAQDNKVFNPIEKKAEICSQLEGIKSTLSCEGESCLPLYESAVPELLQLTFSQACSFNCVAGEQMCNETLNPDSHHHFGHATPNYRKCDPSYNLLIGEERSEDQDDDGNKLIEVMKVYQQVEGCDKEDKGDCDTCEEYIDYIEVCDKDGSGCKEIELYSEEWNEYKRQQQVKVYEESCFIPSEEDCKNISNEMGACMLGGTKSLLQALCAPSTDNLWRYRKSGGSVFFLGGPNSVEVKEAENMKPDEVKKKD